MASSGMVAPLLGQRPVSHHQFDPYADNGGSILAIAGEDYCIVAGDTRHSDGYLINTRYAPKVYQLTGSTALATSGFHADGLAFTKELGTEIELYEFRHDKPISTQSIAQAMSVRLYSRRFFPYYTFNILGGLDEQGRGAVYSFDPVGSFEREGYRAGGSAASLLQPFLDNQIGFHNQKANARALPLETAVAIAKDAFMSATERDIHTGDYLELFIITAAGVRVEKMDLKKD